MSASHAAAETAPHASGHDDSLAAPDKPFNGTIILAIAFTLCCIVVFVFGTFELFSHTMSDQVKDMQLSPMDNRLAKLHETERRLLDGYQWIDKKNDVVRIPVLHAQEAVQREWASRATGTVANPIGGPAPVAAPDAPPPAPAPAAIITPAPAPLHPQHRMGLPLAPNAPGKKPAAVVKPKVK